MTSVSGTINCIFIFLIYNLTLLELTNNNDTVTFYFILTSISNLLFITMTSVAGIINCIFILLIYYLSLLELYNNNDTVTNVTNMSE